MDHKEKKKEIRTIVSHCPPVGVCPAIYKVEDGYVAVGAVVKTEDYDGLSERVGSDEGAVLIPNSLIEELKSK